MAKKVGGGGAIMQPYDKDGEYSYNDGTPERVPKNNPPQDADKSIDDLKKQIQEETKPEENKVIDAEREVNKKTITDSKAFKTIEKNANKIVKDLDRLDSDQLKVVSKYINKLEAFTNESGVYRCSGRIVGYSQDYGGSLLSKELGFDFDATTFYHEYGHFIDNMDARANGGYMWSFDSVNVNVSEDALNCFNMIAKEGGGIPVSSLNRISRNSYDAFYKGLAKITGKDQKDTRLNPEDFGFVYEPTKPMWSVENAIKYFGEAQGERYKSEWEKYNLEMQDYLARKKSGENQKAWDRYLAANEEKKEKEKGIDIQMERFGIISDFFGLYTNGRIDPHGKGYWGHSRAYNKTTSVQEETWAEYFSFKMTNDKVGLDIMKKYLPNTFNAFEEKFNKIKE